jgi:hypothetical protein
VRARMGDAAAASGVWGGGGMPYQEEMLPGRSHSDPHHCMDVCQQYGESAWGGRVKMP